MSLTLGNKEEFGELKLSLVGLHFPCKLHSKATGTGARCSPPPPASPVAAPHSFSVTCSREVGKEGLCNSAASPSWSCSEVALPRALVCSSPTHSTCPVGAQPGFSPAYRPQWGRDLDHHREGPCRFKCSWRGAPGVEGAERQRTLRQPCH